MAGNACGSATRRQRVSTVSALVLRSTPGGPHLPHRPFHSLTVREEGGGSILTFPADPSAPSRREWKGEGASSPSPPPLSAPSRREWKGEGASSPSPQPLSAPSRREWKGEDQRSRGDTSQITPLPHRGRGARGEGLPQRGRGAGGDGGPHLPRSPFRSLTTGVEGGGWRRERKHIGNLLRNGCTGTVRAQSNVFGFKRLSEKS